MYETGFLSRVLPAARKRASIPVALGALALALAACGGSTAAAPAKSTAPVKASSAATTTPAKASSSAGSGSSTSSIAAFRSCLAKHGVTLPTRRPGTSGTGATGGAPPGGAAGFNSAAFRSASQACAKYRPTGGFGAGFGAGSAARASAIKTYTNCLQIHGVTVTFGAGRSSTTTTTTPAQRAAYTACASLLPKRPAVPGKVPTGTGTGTTTAG